MSANFRRSNYDNEAIVLPIGWTLATLDQISEIILGQSPPSSTYNEKGIGLPFYQGKLEFGEIYPTPRKWCSAPKKMAQKGDVLISVRAPVGPTNICPEESCIGRGLAAIRGLCGISSFFVLYLMRNLENVIAGESTGTTFEAISGNQLRNLKIPLPPLPEQNRIVAKIEELFTKLDAGVKSLETVKAYLKGYRQSVLKSAFEGKLTEEWRRTHKDELEPAPKLMEWIKEEKKKLTTKKYRELPSVDMSHLPELPEGWSWTRVGEVVTRIQYGSSEKATGDPSGIPVLRMGNIQEGKVVFEDLKYFSKDTPQLNDVMLDPGDVLFNRTNSAELVGKTAVYEHWHPKAAFASYLIRVKVDGRIYDPHMLAFFINSYYGRRYIASVVSQQVGQANVNGTKLSLMPIPITCLPEQEAITQEIERRFSVADEAERTIVSGSRQSEKLRQSILKRAFEGKLVPQDPSDEPASILLERLRSMRTQATQDQRGKRVRKRTDPRQRRLV